MADTSIGQIRSIHKRGIDLTWRRLAPLPDKNGFAGAFVGVSNGALIVAGGANFPDEPVWAGGKKVWYDKIFVLERRNGRWKTGFTLPKAMGYGVSITTSKGLMCIGGADAEKHLSDVFVLEWLNGRIKRTDMPPLPKPIAYASGALVGKTVYVAGGTETPTATVAGKEFWSLDISKSRAKWEQLKSWPGPERMLSVAGSDHKSFYLFSGASLSTALDGSPKRTYLKDAYRFGPGDRWTRITDLPQPVLAAPTPAAASKSGLLIFGGDDGSKLGFKPVEKHPGFSHSILRYDPIRNAWSENGLTEAAHVTTALAAWRGGWVIASGEIRPGVRTPEVWFVKKK